MLALGLGLQGCSFGPDEAAAQFDSVDGRLPEDTGAALTGVLEQAIALSGASGGVAGVWAPWAGSWTAASGTVSFDEGADKVTTDTPFRMGTITSEVTCTAVLKLADAGRLDLGDDIAEDVDWIPGLEGVTYEELCRHTSGIADYYPHLENVFVSNPERPWSENELVAAAMALPRTGEAGEQVRPSRTGVLLAGMGAKRVTGQSWNDLARGEVLGPLGMESTAIPAPTSVGSGVLGAYSAAVNPDGKLDCKIRYDDSRQSSSIGGSAAGATTTLGDLRRFSEAFATGSLLSESMAAKQWKTHPVGGDAPSWVEAGIGGQSYGPMRGDAGETAGALTAAFTDPESGLTVVVALNNSSPPPGFVREVAFALASIGSKAAPAEGRDAPIIELPWSLEQATAKMQESAPCADVAVETTLPAPAAAK
ncbi:serine hydrolase domain-containing protein [Agromyces salentinus]|uniref:Beta-lactamase-related domain-containing protein n=1 Tax=Agromyces salentinus TaxID=269421 RepID=A0ABN2MHP9_9MICO|nr:serine hydrolase domain-containing protein [Agromyces salentinus]